MTASLVTMTEITDTSPTRTPREGLEALPKGLFTALLMTAVPRSLEFPLLKPFLLIHPPVPLYVLLVPVTKTVSANFVVRLFMSRFTIFVMLRMTLMTTGTVTVSSEGMTTLPRVSCAETLI